jgi:hypothetical protein
LAQKNAGGLARKKEDATAPSFFFFIGVKNRMPPFDYNQYTHKGEDDDDASYEWCVTLALVGSLVLAALFAFYSPQPNLL